MPPPTLPFFSFNHPATTEISTLSLHDALPISSPRTAPSCIGASNLASTPCSSAGWSRSCGRCVNVRSEEHTSELQSHSDLVCRLLLEKKKTQELRPLTSGSLHGPPRHDKVLEA